MDVDEISVITGLDRDRVLAAVHALSAEQRAVAVSEFFDGAGPLAAAQRGEAPPPPVAAPAAAAPAAATGSPRPARASTTTTPSAPALHADEASDTREAATAALLFSDVLDNEHLERALASTAPASPKAEKKADAATTATTPATTTPPTTAAAADDLSAEEWCHALSTLDPRPLEAPLDPRARQAAVAAIERQPRADPSQLSRKWDALTARRALLVRRSSAAWRRQAAQLLVQAGAPRAAQASAIAPADPALWLAPATEAAAEEEAAEAASLDVARVDAASLLAPAATAADAPPFAGMAMALLSAACAEVPAAARPPPAPSRTRAPYSTLRSSRSAPPPPRPLRRRRRDRRRHRQQGRAARPLPRAHLSTMEAAPLVGSARSPPRATRARRRRRRRSSGSRCARVRPRRHCASRARCSRRRWRNAGRRRR